MGPARHLAPADPHACSCLGNSECGYCNQRCVLRAVLRHCRSQQDRRCTVVDQQRGQLCRLLRRALQPSRQPAVPDERCRNRLARAITPGAFGTLQNSQCVLDGATSSAVAAGTNLTVNASVSFKPAFIGSKNIYLLATDTKNSKSSAWAPARHLDSADSHTGSCLGNSERGHRDECCFLRGLL